MECGLCGRLDDNAQSLTSQNALRIFSRVTKVFTLQTKFCAECYNTLKKLYKTGKKKELLRRRLEKEAIATASLNTVASEIDTIRNNSSSNDVVSPIRPAPLRAKIALAYQEVGSTTSSFEDERRYVDDEILEETNSDESDLVPSTSADLSITPSQSSVASFVSASDPAIVQPDNAGPDSLISEINGSNQLNHSVTSNPVIVQPDNADAESLISEITGSNQLNHSVTSNPVISSRAGSLSSDVVSSNFDPIAPHRIQRTNVDFPIFRRVFGG